MKIQTKIVDYIKESYVEMRRVVWPTRKQTIQHTVIVIIFSLVVAFFLGALDIIFSWGLENILNIKR